MALHLRRRQPSLLDAVVSSLPARVVANAGLEPSQASLPAFSPAQEPGFTRGSEKPAAPSASPSTSSGALPALVVATLVVLIIAIVGVIVLIMLRRQRRQRRAQRLAFIRPFVLPPESDDLEKGSALLIEKEENEAPSRRDSDASATISIYSAASAGTTRSTRGISPPFPVAKAASFKLNVPPTATTRDSTPAMHGPPPPLRSPPAATTRDSTPAMHGPESPGPVPFPFPPPPIPDSEPTSKRREAYLARQLARLTMTNKRPLSSGDQSLMFSPLSSVPPDFVSGDMRRASVATTATATVVGRKSMRFQRLTLSRPAGRYSERESVSFSEWAKTLVSPR
ncbi:hypothetical protein MIND_01209100 [Mycena indigotica]|uniref:Uncharacterized protein n=1 Tax=Mycena indigotica TaxID=2126181 RepID=A0A8H6S790_9AGAR|nr:uncharacterized protein MIND_01209100 [Mycena indigotica]KAF7293097.1 hypothetical protein MIND_01209100 [Mycena indigotica]